MSRRQPLTQTRVPETRTLPSLSPPPPSPPSRSLSLRRRTGALTFLGTRESFSTPVFHSRPRQSTDVGTDGFIRKWRWRANVLIPVGKNLFSIGGRKEGVYIRVCCAPATFQRSAWRVDKVNQNLGARFCLFGRVGQLNRTATANE